MALTSSRTDGTDELVDVPRSAALVLGFPDPPKVSGITLNALAFIIVAEGLLALLGFALVATGH
jgi:hypothetical protein